jgi:hypothetical protein
VIENSSSSHILLEIIFYSANDLQKEKEKKKKRKEKGKEKEKEKNRKNEKRV